MDGNNLFKKTVIYKGIGLLISYILVLIYYGESTAIEFTIVSTAVFTIYYVLFELYWNKYNINTNT
jgi:phosphotransferase system  glucose/maltose/N-acetylglucosamine-specific IIC component